MLPILVLRIFLNAVPKSLLLFIGLVLGASMQHASAQILPVKELIRIWKIDDTSQTRQVERTYLNLRKYYHKDTLLLRIKQLEQYQQDDANLRITARIMMYKMHGEPDYSVKVQDFLQCMQQASALGDEQLLSEMYAKYAEIKAPQSKKLYYLLKAIKIQEKIGAKHFPNIYFRYFSVSDLCYRIADYKQSLGYGLKGLKAFDLKNGYFLDYILLADLVGASYKDLKQTDSALFYYEQLNALVTDYKSHPHKYSKVRRVEPYIIAIWEGVIAGGIGRALVIKGEPHKAYPYLKKNLDTSLKYNERGNAASVLNVMAKANYDLKNYRQSLAQYKQAQAYLTKVEDDYYYLRTKVSAAEGLSKLYIKFKKYDSAYLYQREYAALKSRVQDSIAAIQFAGISAGIEIENVQQAYEVAANEVLKQRQLRNVFFGGIVVATLLALLLYNRKHLKYKIIEQRLESEKQLAYAEMDHAKEQLNVFARNMADKNKLIEKLQQKYDTQGNNDDSSLKQISILTEDDWLGFKKTFDKVYPNFFENAKRIIPEISNAELRFLSLSKLNISTKEIANAQGISAESVRKQRHRLRKKIEAIMPNSNVETFLSQI